MKKFLIIVVILFVVVLGAAALIPVIFKDDITAAIDKEIDHTVRATVYYDTDHLELTLFKNFPNITVGMSDFGVIGVDEFEEDTLVSVGSFQVVLDIMSVISGDQIKIKGITLNEPDIHIIVLEDGTANYDIAKDTGTTTEEVASDEPSAPISIGIDNWSINNARFVYYDLSLPFYTTIDGLNHSGSGDFEQDVFDMVTTTTIDEFGLSYDNVEYLSNKTISADITMSMDLVNSTYTFKENLVKLNDFPLAFEGFIAMPSEDIDMDIKFSGQEISLTSILSLIPGVYQEYTTGLKASGNVAFDGSVAGTYNAESMPVVKTSLSVSDGSIEYTDVPFPLEAVNMDAVFEYPSADLRETSFVVNNFSMLLDGEKTTASLIFRDLEDYYWKLNAETHLDLGKLTKVVPLEEGMTLEGKINGTLITEGRMSAVDAEEYDKLPTSGSLAINDFKFVSPDLPQGFSISESSMTFDPKALKLASFNADIGGSDMSANGMITNYLGYALQPDEVLVGTLDFSSKKMDLNQFMVESDEEVVVDSATMAADTVPMAIVVIPKNIDFTLNSSLDEIIYDNLTLTNAKGALLVKNGEVIMDGLNFNMLDGTFTMDGAYSTVDPEVPTFDFKLGIKELSIAQAYKAFSTVQVLAPVAEKMTGKFSTDFSIGGVLGEDMMPLYDQLTGDGLLNIASAAVADMKLLSAVSSVSNLSQKDGQLQLNDVLMFAEIKDGRVHLKPFDVSLGGYKTNISGSNGIDGSLNYDLKMDVPNGAVGQAVTNAISSFAGKTFAANNSDLVMRFNVGGVYDDPKVRLAGIETKEGTSIGSSVKAEVTEVIDEKKAEIAEEVNATKDSLVNQGKEIVSDAKDEVKDEIKDATKDEIDKAKDKLKGLLGKKKKKKKDN